MVANYHYSIAHRRRMLVDHQCSYNYCHSIAFMQPLLMYEVVHCKVHIVMVSIDGATSYEHNVSQGLIPLRVFLLHY